MRILTLLTYYQPHLSGLSVYAKRLAESLALRGHEVTVLTSRHEKSLPFHEELNGVSIERVYAPFAVHKGAVMPFYFKKLIPLLKNHDIISLHLPNTPIETFSALTGVLLFSSKPIVTTYHCDLTLPKGIVHRLIDFIVFLANIFSGLRSTSIVANTQDYVNHSNYLQRFSSKIEIIPPPVHMPQIPHDNNRSLRYQYGSTGKVLIGCAARLAAEKGIEFLLRSIPFVSEKIKDFHVLFAGEHEHVIGENKYKDQILPLIRQYSDVVTFLGVLSEGDMADFFSSCDVVVLPSVNSTESFGMIQVESMLCGTPVVATDIPGVRTPVQTTGMGRLVPPKNPEKLAEAIIEVILNRNIYVFPRRHIEKHYSMDTTVNMYERLFEKTIHDNKKY